MTVKPKLDISWLFGPTYRRSNRGRPVDAENFEFNDRKRYYTRTPGQRMGPDPYGGREKSPFDSGETTHVPTPDLVRERARCERCRHAVGVSREEWSAVAQKRVKDREERERQKLRDEWLREQRRLLPARRRELRSKIENVEHELWCRQQWYYPPEQPHNTWLNQQYMNRLTAQRDQLREEIARVDNEASQSPG